MTPRFCRFVLAVLLGFTGVGLGASPDDLILKDGRFIENVKVSKVEKGFKIHYENGEVFVPAELVKDHFIEHEDGTFEPRNDAERAKLEKGLVPFEGKWVKKKRRDSVLAKRAKEKREIIERAKSHQEWRNRYIDKTKNFQFEYTLDPDIFRDMQQLMEAYYKVFTKHWGIRRPSKLGRLKVCFYHDYETFLQVAGTRRGVLGYYRHYPLERLELNFFYDRVDPEYTVAVMFHEANHYLTHLIDLNFSYPHCIGEAMAEYYGASKWDPKKKKMSTGHLLEGRLVEVQTDMQGGDIPSLEDYLSNRLEYLDYTWGWTFVHFMMETKKYTKKFKSFFLGLARDSSVKRTRNFARATVDGPEILRYFKAKMRIKDLRALEEEWLEYVRANLKVTSHRGFEQAGKRAMGTGQRLKARRFLRKAIDNGSTNPDTYLRYAELLLTHQKRDEAITYLRQAITHDPLHAMTYARLGRYLTMGRDDEGKKEGERLLLLAAEIAPDDINVMVEAALHKQTGDKKTPAKN